jgi:hypothetical protein
MLRIRNTADNNGFVSLVLIIVVMVRHPVERVLLEGADGDAADAGAGLSGREESRILCQVILLH